MSEHGPDEYSPEHTRKLLPSELMFMHARQAQLEVNIGTHSFSELNALAKQRCNELNDEAIQTALISEKISVDVEHVVVANNVHQKYEGQQIDGREPDVIEGLEKLTGEFAGYGYYILPRDGVYSCVIGAKIVPSYDMTLPFSNAESVAFCPVGLSSPEFAREQKDHRLEAARVKLRHAVDAVDWNTVESLTALDVVQAMHDIDEVLIDRTIEDIDFLNTLSVMVPLLLLRLEPIPDSTPIIDRLLDVLSVQLELPQRLSIEARKYRSSIRGSSAGWAVHMDPRSGPRQLRDLETHLIIAPASHRSELFLSGMYNERTVQVLLSDIVAITPLQ